jgi:hypothetical protein
MQNCAYIFDYIVCTDGEYICVWGPLLYTRNTGKPFLLVVCRFRGPCFPAFVHFSREGAYVCTLCGDAGLVTVLDPGQGHI